DEYAHVKPTMGLVRTHIQQQYPNVQLKLKPITLGPASGSKIEARIIGPEPTELRAIAKQVEARLHQDPHAVYIRHDWRERTKVLEPEFNE
ncbi:hypothetical protein, partial [Bacillus cereus group sp. Bce005]|uniref:hypothetical protein n=1 Tax=Bacillus cereus group sp. Bce005 TaxID=3445256 RepID=UPI003F696315